MDEQQQPGDQAAQSDKALPPIPPVNTDTKDPERNSGNPAKDKKKRKRKPLSCFEIWTVILAILGILVAAGTGVAIYWQAVIAQDAIRLSQRPWIGFADDDPSQGLTTGPIQFDPQGNAIIYWQIVLKNFGTTAGQNAWANAQLMITNNLQSILVQEKSSCDSVLKPAGKGGTLLPGRSRYRVAVGSIWPQNQIDTSTEQQIWFVGCIGYLDQGGHPYHHGFSDWLTDNTTNKVITVRPQPGLRVEGHFMAQHESID